MVDCCLKSLLLRFFHISCGKQSFSLRANVSDDPTIFVKVMCRMSCPEKVLYFP